MLGGKARSVSPHAGVPIQFMLLLSLCHVSTTSHVVLWVVQDRAELQISKPRHKHFPFEASTLLSVPEGQCHHHSDAAGRLFPLVLGALCPTQRFPLESGRRCNSLAAACSVLCCVAAAAPVVLLSKRKKPR